MTLNRRNFMKTLGLTPFIGLPKSRSVVVRNEKPALLPPKKYFNEEAVQHYTDAFRYIYTVPYKDIEIEADLLITRYHHRWLKDFDEKWLDAEMKNNNMPFGTYVICFGGGALRVYDEKKYRLSIG